MGREKGAEKNIAFIDKTDFSRIKKMVFCWKIECKIQK
jgi:hypothetical protein